MATRSAARPKPRPAARTKASAAKKPTRAGSRARASDARREASDNAVERATGKPLTHWFRVLDAFAKKQGEHNHKLAAAHLHKAHAVPEWWCQMVTVFYERECGHRQKYQTSSGFSASASRTINAPISKLYQAWHGRARSKWLPDDFTVRKATEDRSLRITWNDGTNLEVMFYPKGDAKAQVTIQHGKLRNAALVTRVKAEWNARLDALQELLES